MDTRSSRHHTSPAEAIVFVPVIVRGEVCGVLGVGRAAGLRAVAMTPARLEQVSTWLAAGIARHLQSPAVDAHDMGPLFRVLETGLQQGSDRALVSVFAEAMAVWHDIEVVGCVEISPSRFANVVSPAGRAEVVSPIALPPEAVPDARQLVRMSAADVDGLAPGSVPEVLVTTLTRRSGGRVWLLVCFGATDGCDGQRLSNYVAALDMAMGQLAANARADLTASICLRLPSDGPALDDAIASVVSDLTRRLAADAVMVIAESPALRSSIRIGSKHALPRSRESDRRRLVIARRTPSRHAALVAVLRDAGADFTPVEREMVETAADVILAWIGRPEATAGAQEDPVALEARFESLAQDALDRGTAITAVVISTGRSYEDSGRTGAWVEQIKRGMRQSDDVGLLRAGEIGLLLRHTTADPASAVTRRVQALLQATDDRGGLGATIGFETRFPGRDGGAGIVQAARARVRPFRTGR